MLLEHNAVHIELKTDYEHQLYNQPLWNYNAVRIELKRNVACTTNLCESTMQFILNSKLIKKHQVYN